MIPEMYVPRADASIHYLNGDETPSGELVGMCPDRGPRDIERSVQTAMNFCFKGEPEPYLDRSGLREALGHILPSRPSFRTIERWVDRGLPFGRDPGNGRRRYLLSRVLVWYEDAIRYGSPAAEGRAHARHVHLATACRDRRSRSPGKK